MANERRKWMKKWMKTQSEKKIKRNEESVSDELYREGKQSFLKRGRNSGGPGYPRSLYSQFLLFTCQKTLETANNVRND